jgi:hypothetical protein
VGNEGRATKPDHPVEGMLTEAANAESATRHRGVGQPAVTRGDTVANRDQGAARVDAVAGSEFLDDQLDFG